VQCPKCGSSRLGVYRTCHDTAESVLRQRKCAVCGHKFFTVEVELPDGAAKHARDKQEKLQRLPGFLRVGFS
jgi:transcriptional regulator NrdR family protein